MSDAAIDLIDNESLLKELESLKEEISILKSNELNLNDKVTQLTESESNLSKEKEDSEIEMMELRSVKQKLEIQGKVDTERIEELEKEMNQRISDVENEWKEKISHFENLEKESTNESNEKIKKLEAELADKEINLAQLQKQYDDSMKEAREELENELFKHTQVVEKLEKEYNLRIKHLESEISNNADTMSKFEKLENEYKDKVKHFEAELSNERSQSKDQSEKEKEYLEKLTLLTTQYNEKIKSSEYENEIMLKNLNEELTNGKNLLIAKEDEYKQKFAIFENENKEQIQKLENAFTLAENSNKELNKQINDLNTQIGSKQELINLNAEEISKFQENKSSLEKENKASLDKIEELTKNITEFEKTVNELKELKELKTSSAIDTENAIKEKEAELEDLRDKFNKAQEDRTYLKDKLTRKDQEIKMFLKDIEDKQQTIVNLEGSIHEKLEIIIFKDRELDDQQKKYFINTQMTEEKFNKKILELNWKIDDQLEKIKGLEDKLPQEVDSTEPSELKSHRPNIDMNSDKVEFIKNTCKEIANQMMAGLKDYEFQIDSRIISNILFKYFDKSANEKLKSALMDTLAGIMGYNNDDRKKIGLSVQNNSLSNRNSGYSSNSHKDNLLDIVQEFYEFLDKI